MVDVRPSSLARLEGTVRAHVLPEWGDTALSGVSNADVRAWAARLYGRGYSPSTVRTALQRWLDAEQEPQTRLEALRDAAEVRELVEEVLDQRVLEARSFRHTWAEIAAPSE